LSGIRKSTRKRKKHKVSFERAATFFKDAHTISIFDDEHTEGEDRWVTLGKDGGGILLVVCHTFRMIDESTYGIRIISSRKATKREAKQYEE
jgi:uncharacterized DUF497 family protein